MILWLLERHFYLTWQCLMHIRLVWCLWAQVASHEAVGLPYETWTASEIQRRLNFDLQSYGPQVRIDHEAFGEPTGPELTEGVYFPTTGGRCSIRVGARKADFMGVLGCFEAQKAWKMIKCLLWAFF